MPSYSARDFFSDSQQMATLTANAVNVSTNVIDRRRQGDDVFRQTTAYAKLDSTIAPAGAAITAELQHSDDETPGNFTALIVGQPVNVAGEFSIQHALPPHCKRYMRMVYKVGGTAITAPAPVITAGIRVGIAETRM